MKTVSNIDRITTDRIRQLGKLRREAKALESQLRSKRGNRSELVRDLLAIRSILTEVLS